ncbi:sugar transferase [Bacillus anthracis]|uniref:sugar transferase n=1 Tax=Bacillus TaxID=1386 RepID=UPI0003FE4670|nr:MULTISPECIES: sugar transferase [Bacillus cereus group]OTY59813.1 sugar transferase [Bacillus thuringiensis serovar graciosensis]PFC81212.1 sugar transferase [Bacillus anthracis]PFT23188.1 sugar transferase [Bacillus thuringiensis]AXY10750.1 sugar transferase [Bacillus thuringiensis LM1212]KXY86671.1 sugar transferase [Bacillus cereus]
MKRLFDVCVSLLFLLLFSIVICIVAILVRIKLGSPILFKQERPGMNGIPFYLFKFRTMTNEINGDGNWLPDEVRLTAFGKTLRKYSIDELPQLINVIKGDLSLVGPRPLLMEYLPLYSSKQAKRHNVKPGITGWAQINGRNLITWEEKFELDVWYVENQSFLLDLKIIVLTILKVFKTEGISHVGHVTMERFTGGEIEIKGEGK